MMKNNKSNLFFKINDQELNKFDFYNKNLCLTDITSFNSKRLVFSEPATEKIPNSEMTYQRIFITVLGPIPRNVSKKIQNVYDVNELLSYDKSQKMVELTKFSKLKEEDYHVLVNLNWYNSQNKVTLSYGPTTDTFLYNMIDTIYTENDKENIEILRDIAEKQFTVFDATQDLKDDPTLLDQIPANKYHVLLKPKWAAAKLSTDWLTAAKQYHCLTILSNEVFSFGLSQNQQDEKSGNISYQISMCLFDQKNPTDQELKWAVKYDEIAAICRNECSKVPKFKYTSMDMKGLTWTKDTINIQEGPKLYPKIIFKQDRAAKVNEPPGSFVTIFTEQTPTGLVTIQDPFSIVNKRAVVQVCMKFESIFLGIRVAMQTRVNDVLIVKWIEAFKPRALITRKPAQHEDSSKSVDSDSSDSSDSSASSSAEEDEKRTSPVSRSKRLVKTIPLLP
jgi:hypothetical protein